MHDEFEALRRELERSRNDRGRVRPDGELRARLARYVRGRRQVGAKWTEIAKELRAGHAAVRRWERDAGRVPKMVAVQVCEPPKAGGAVRMIGGHGVIIEINDLDIVVELLRRLS
jgi:hypothetical protein